MIPIRKSLPNVWLGLPIVLVLLTVWTSTDFPLDYWLHVNAGRWISDQGQLIEADSFSHTIAGQPVQNQAWLAQWAMYAIHRIGGYPLSQFLAGVSYAAALGLIMALSRRRARRPAVAALWGLIAFALMASNLGVRPQAASVLLFALQLTWLDRLRRPVWLALACFATEAIWTNTHGAFPLGVVMPVLMMSGAFSEAIRREIQRDKGWPARLISAACSPRVRRLAIASAAAALGAFINPHPENTLSYVAGVSSASAQRGLEEWLPPHVAMPAGAALAIASLVVLGVIVISNRRLRWDELALLVPFAILAVGSQRMVAWWGLVLPWVMARSSATVRFSPTLVRLWQRWSGGPAAATSPALDAAFVAVAALGVLFCTPWLRPYNLLLPAAKRTAVPIDEPWQLAEALPRLMIAASHDDGQKTDEPTRPITWFDSASFIPKGGRTSVRSIAPLSWGSYLSWHSQGRIASFVDSRVDFFPDQVWADYQRIQGAAPDALKILDDYGVDLVVCGPHNQTLADRLTNSNAWREVYGDSLARAFVRRNTGPLAPAQ
ncbi:MAG: hypothetical protein U0795_02855 [Pirellulales bacterium]